LTFRVAGRESVTVLVAELIDRIVVLAETPDPEATIPMTRPLTNWTVTSVRFASAGFAFAETTLVVVVTGAKKVSEVPAVKGAVTPFDRVICRRTVLIAKTVVLPGMPVPVASMPKARPFTELSVSSVPPDAVAFAVAVVTDKAGDGGV
jgi:hypothetical protein